MRYPLPEAVEAGRDLTGARYGSPRGAPRGLFTLTCPATGRTLRVLFGGETAWVLEGVEGPPWEHASVSVDGRLDTTPTWEEMAWVASLFWDDSECLVQYRPPLADYVNCHPGCLHWGRPGRSGCWPTAGGCGPRRS
jgi:hypothetical protein